MCLSAGCQSDAGARAHVCAGTPHRCISSAEVLAGVWLPWHRSAAFVPDVKTYVYSETGMKHWCLVGPRFRTCIWLPERSLPQQGHGPGWGLAARAPAHVGKGAVHGFLWGFLPLATPWTQVLFSLQLYVQAPLKVCDRLPQPRQALQLLQQGPIPPPVSRILKSTMWLPRCYVLWCSTFWRRRCMQPPPPPCRQRTA